MTPPMRLLLALALFVLTFGLAACDSTAEDAPARFDGHYQAIGPWPSTVGGPYGYTFDLQLANDADGVVSGSGTFVFISERTGPRTPRAIEVSGTTEGNGVGMRLSTNGYDDLPFWGRVSLGGEVIDGNLSVYQERPVPGTVSVPVTFKKVP